MTLTLRQVAEMTGGVLVGDPDYVIDGAAPLDAAGPRDITFAEKRSLLKESDTVAAGAVLVNSGVTVEKINVIQSAAPRLAFTKVLAHFHPQKRPATGIHPSATVGDACRVGNHVHIGAGAVVGDRVQLGDHVTIHPLVVLGDDVVVGDHTIIYPHVAILDRCSIGQRCIIHAGTIIGADGFGFVPEGGRHLKIPQTGIVRIDDDVEIGAANTIDRATFGQTWIKTGVKTDDQVHIGHNVVVGEHTIIVAQAGIAGSTTIGQHVILAAQAGITGHIHIADGAVVGPRTGIAKSIEKKEIISGAVVGMPHRTWLRFVQVVPELPEMHKQLKRVEKQLAALTKQVSGES